MNDIECHACYVDIIWRDGKKDKEKDKRKNIISKKRCDVNDIECHVIMTLSGERGREHWPFPRLTAGAVCIVLYTVCITVCINVHHTLCVVCIIVLCEYPLNCVH